MLLTTSVRRTWSGWRHVRRRGKLYRRHRDRVDRDSSEDSRATLRRRRGRDEGQPMSPWAGQQVLPELRVRAPRLARAGTPPRRSTGCSSGHCTARGGPKGPGRMKRGALSSSHLRMPWPPSQFWLKPLWPGHPRRASRALTPLNDPVAFAAELEPVRRAALQMEKVEAERTHGIALDATSSWWKSAPLPSAMMEMLRAHWAPSFERPRPADFEDVDAWFQARGRKWPVMHGSGRSWMDVAGAAGCARDAAPGPSGHRYAAWRRAGRISCESFSGLMRFVIDGEDLPEAFAATLLAFSPKMTEERENHEVWRHEEVLLCFREACNARTRSSSSMRAIVC